MVKRRTDCYKCFLCILSVILFCLTACAGKTNGKPAGSVHINAIESEIKIILNQLDSFNPKEREKGSRSIHQNKILSSINKLSESLDIQNRNSNKNYLATVNKKINEIRPVVPALFSTALDIHPSVKSNSFDSLQSISSCLLKIIFTAYSIKNNTGDKKDEKIYNDAEKILKNAKTLNEDIITFFRNETADSGLKFRQISLQKIAFHSYLKKNTSGSIMT